MRDYSPARPIVRPIGGRPEHLIVSRTQTQLQIVYRWRRFDFIALLVAAIAWTTSLAILGTLAPSGLTRIVTLLCVLPGLGGAYLAVAGIMNRTVLVADHTMLTVWHGPVPLLAPARIPAQKILQLYITTRLVGSRWGMLSRLWAITEDGRRFAVTSPLLGDEENTAGWIERELEEHFGIVNRAVVCASCGYDLRATARRCPECGRAIDGTKHDRRRWRQWRQSRGDPSG